MNKKRNEGFSLLEVVVYIAVLSVVAGVFTNIFQSVIKTQLDENSQNEVTRQLNFSMQTIQRLIRNSTAVQYDTCGATTTLSLSMSQASQNPTIIYKENSKIYITEGSGVPQTLTSDTITVDFLQFKIFCNYGAKETVEIDIQGSKTEESTGNVIIRTLNSATSRL